MCDLRLWGSNKCVSLDLFNIGVVTDETGHGYITDGIQGIWKQNNTGKLIFKGLRYFGKMHSTFSLFYMCVCVCVSICAMFITDLPTDSWFGPVFSYQNLSPTFKAWNWRPAIQANKGPTLPSSIGISDTPPVQTSISSTLLKDKRKYKWSFSRTLKRICASHSVYLEIFRHTKKERTKFQ